MNNSSDVLLPVVKAALDATSVPYQAIACDPELADTAVFCEQYGYSLADSANTIVVRGKTGDKRMVACVLLATHKLDVNADVRARIGSRRVSFASGDETVEVTRMVLGGVTPIGLPTELPVWVNGAVMERDQIILGGGNRDSKIIVSPSVFEQLHGVEVVPGLAKLK